MSADDLARILLIEDNETNLQLMVYLLGAFAYTTLSARDGLSGVEMARRERPELIVCDVHLPRLDGYGIVQELKSDELLRDIPIVAVTALAMVGDRDRILAAGFDGYVSKPIAPETFVHEIEKFLPTKFRSHVRRTTPAPVATADTKGATAAVGATLATILVVDDVAANLEFARSAFEPSGYRVLTAKNVDKAIALTREQRPNLLLCDLHMEPHTGLDLLDRVKTDPALQEIPLVIISSTATTSGERSECLAHGAAGFIRRPIEPEALLAEVAKTLAEARRP